MVEQGAEIAIGVGVPVANNLGAIGLIVVLCFIGVLVGVIYFAMKVISNMKEQNDSLIKHNKEIHDNGREDAKLGRDALKSLTDAIVLSRRSGGG